MTDITHKSALNRLSTAITPATLMAEGIAATVSKRVTTQLLRICSQKEGRKMKRKDEGELERKAAAVEDRADDDP